MNQPLLSPHPTPSSLAPSTLLCKRKKPNLQWSHPESFCHLSVCCQVLGWAEPGAVGSAQGCVLPGRRPARCPGVRPWARGRQESAHPFALVLAELFGNRSLACLLFFFFIT